MSYRLVVGASFSISTNGNAPPITCGNFPSLFSITAQLQIDDRYFLLRRQALQGESPQDEPHTPTKRLLLPQSSLSLAIYRVLVNEKISEIFLLLIWGYNLFLSVIPNNQALGL